MCVRALTSCRESASSRQSFRYMASHQYSRAKREAEEVHAMLVTAPLESKPEVLSVGVGGKNRNVQILVF